MSNKPVLLIGLGGTGSEIVAKIYHAIPENEKEKVVVHIFDTDVNAVAKLNLKATDRTIISSDLTVEKCLLKDYIKRSNASAWFPVEHPSILKTKFSDGAGQIRVVSRLSYLDAIGSKKLVELEKKLGEFYQINGSDYDDVRVMIVCSIAGGTGSGIFLQTGLFIKDYFESRGKGVKTRGAFLLPDIFVKNGISPGRLNNMYANGYACLKELDAIIKSTMGTSEENNVNIQLAYKPEMADEKVTLNPYDCVFLYDYENIDGKHLVDLDAYKDQIAKTLYLQLFSDIAGASDSDEINMIINIVENDGRARYASSGVATLEYPYDEVVRYCTNRLASEKIGKDWLKLDDLYDFEVKEVENYKKQGVHRETPKKYIRMNELFDNEVKSNNILLKKLNRTLHLINSDGDLGEKKTKEFLKAVEKKVNGDYADSKEYRNFRAYAHPSEENIFGKPDDIKNEVAAFESSLSNFERKVKETVDDKKNLLCSTIFPLHVIDKSEIGKDDYQLAYWILGKKDGVALHPLASRYFLYEVKQLLENKIKVLDENVSDLLVSIEKYTTSYGNGNSAIDEAVQKANKRGLFGLFGSKSKDFGNEYMAKATKQFKKIEEYGNKSILLGVYKHMLNCINDLIENGEDLFFAKLKEIITDFSLQAQKDETQHEGKTDVSKVFVLADAKCKQKLYGNITDRVDVDNILETSYKDIFLEKYSDFMERKKNGHITRGNNLKEKYKKTILTSYENKIRTTQLIDYDVISALKKEIEFEGHSYEEQKTIMEEKLLNVKNRAKPFMLNSGEHQLKLWGVNPLVIGELTEEEAAKILGNRSEILISDGFSKYEIIRYSSIFGLKAQEFDKFSSVSQVGEMPGVYFQAYKERIEKLNKNELTVTPHLDKRWHCINYMPDINDEQAKKDKNSIIEGFIYGLLFENIVIREKDGRDIWVFKDANGAQEIKNGGKELIAQYPVLFTGLGNNPFIVDEIKEMFADKKEREFSTYNRQLEEHSYIKFAKEGSINIIDILIKFVSQSGRANEKDAESKILSILDVFMEKGKNYIKEYYGSTRIRTAVEVFAKYMYAILNSSDEYKNSEKNVSFVDSIIEKIDATVDAEMGTVDMMLDKKEYEGTDFDNLVKFIKERD